MKKTNETRRNEWITMAEYARREGMARSSIFQAVREGRLESNGQTGRACRVRGKIAGSYRQFTPAQYAEFQRLKIEKLRLDTELLKWKSPEYRKEMCRRYMEAMINAYLAAFGDLGDKLEAIGIPIKELVDRCNADFIARARRRVDELN